MIIQIDLGAGGVCLGQKLARMQESGELCDFTILVSGTEVKAHKCVLAASCDYFKMSFSFSELSQSLTQVDFTHVGCGVKAVEKVIRSFYTNEIDLESGCLDSVLRLVDFLMCDKLRLCIELYMERTMTINTAMLYFQLALQYDLTSTGLINDAKWLVSQRFHDFFIYQQETLESSPDMISTYMTFDIFKYCNPQQIVEFMLNNVKLAIEGLRNSAPETALKKETDQRIDNTMKNLSMLLRNIRPSLLEKWKPRLVNFMKAWRKVNLCADDDISTELFWHVQALELEMSDIVTEIDCVCLKNGSYHTCYQKLFTSDCFVKSVVHAKDSYEILVCRNPSCDIKAQLGNQEHGRCVQQLDLLYSKADVEDQTTPKWRLCACVSETSQESPVQSWKTVTGSHIALSVARSEKASGKEKGSTNCGDKQQTSLVNMKTLEHDFQAGGEVGDLCRSKTANILAHRHGYISTVSPHSGSQVTSTESFPDNLTSSDCTRLQEHDCNILVVLAPTGDTAAQLLETDHGTDRPLVRSPKLELSFYDIEFNTWCRGCQLSLPIAGAMLEKHSWRMAFLNDCLYMFSLGHKLGLQYSAFESKWTHLDCTSVFTPHDSTSPVKSVVPITVGRKLIVLSMSREAQGDGTFCMKQQYFEMQNDCQTFVLVASAQGAGMNIPVTQWTVSDRTLVTVKASTMVHGTISRIQYIHVYDVETRTLTTHEADRTMESGVKLLLWNQILYIINKDGWCRLFDLRTSTWSDMKRYPLMAMSSAWGRVIDVTYPALSHAACHAGTSRWEVLSDTRNMVSSLLEIVVKDDGDLDIMYHPSPPFQLVTMICPSTMSRSRLDSIDQARFAHMETLMLDYSVFTQMDNK